MPEEVSLVAVEDVDERVVAEAREVLTELGVTSIEETDPDGEVTTDFVLVVADEEDVQAEAILVLLGTAEATPAEEPEGYAIAVGEVEGVAGAVVAEIRLIEPRRRDGMGVRQLHLRDALLEL